MKRLPFSIFLLILICPSQAQTNYGTITFTNRAGEVIRDAEVTRVTANKLTWRKETAGGVVSLADLPYALQTRFGYDPVAARKADWSEREKKERAQKAETDRRSAVARAIDHQILADGYFQDSTIIFGRVFQKTRTVITIENGPGDSRYVRDHNGYLVTVAASITTFTDLRDVDLGSVNVDDYVHVRAFEPKMTLATNMFGKVLRRLSYTILCAADFASDPRARPPAVTPLNKFMCDRAVPIRAAHN